MLFLAEHRTLVGVTRLVDKSGSATQLRAGGVAQLIVGQITPSQNRIDQLRPFPRDDCSVEGSFRRQRIRQLYSLQQKQIDGWSFIVLTLAGISATIGQLAMTEGFRHLTVATRIIDKLVAYDPE